MLLIYPLPPGSPKRNKKVPHVICKKKRGVVFPHHGLYHFLPCFSSFSLCRLGIILKAKRKTKKKMINKKGKTAIVSSRRDDDDDDEEEEEATALFISHARERAAHCCGRRTLCKVRAVMRERESERAESKSGQRRRLTLSGFAIIVAACHHDARMDLCNLSSTTLILFARLHSSPDYRHRSHGFFQI